MEKETKDYIEDYTKEIKGAERRYFSTSQKPFEIREAQDGEPQNIVYIKGYGALIEVPTILYEDDNESYEEVVSKGAFDDVLEDDVRCLFNHDKNIVLGRSTSGTLMFGADDTGLYYESMLDTNLPSHKNVNGYINRKDVSQSSFAFKVKEEKMECYRNEATGKETYKRTIIKFEKLYDVSPVTFPAYADTTVMGRSVNNVKAEMEAAKNAATEQRKADDLFLAKQLERKIKTNN